MMTRRSFFALALVPFCGPFLRPKTRKQLIAEQWQAAMELQSIQMANYRKATHYYCWIDGRMVAVQLTDSLQQLADASRRLGEAMSASGEKMRLR